MAADRDSERRRGLGAARPLLGYRDTGEDVKQSRGSMIRGWLILAALAVFYLAWTLIVYFLEPGLR
jgi:hypothetical protein